MRVRALHEVYYDGTNHKAGDEFDVQDEHGRLMAINETVAEVTTATTTRDMRAAESGNSKRRDYRRRDMRADE
jgi:hypothetical protein